MYKQQGNAESESHHAGWPLEYRLCMLIMYLACSNCDKCCEMELPLLLLSACRRRGGVINSPRSIFLLSFFFGVESWAAAHG